MALTTLKTIEAAAEEAPRIKPPVDPSTLEHRDLLRGEFWREIPSYEDVTEAQFLDHKWQARHSITKPKKLLEALTGLVSEAFIEDVARGFQRSPMSVRVSPYLLSLVNWADPYNDPLRIQFIPVGSKLLPDHPNLEMDSLHEQSDAPVPGLTHRYRDKALFLALDTCPVYCRFCTRSYAVGIDTERLEKVQLKVNQERWDRVFDYIRSRPELEDIVISGGDAYNLRPDQLRHIGMSLLEMDNIRRMRFATKGPAIMPQKLLTDTAWTDALTEVVQRGRELHKEVVLHTHFNTAREITGITQDAMNLLFERGITVRNQSVMQRGVNDTVEEMQLLVKRMSYINVNPYYVYMHDLVRGVEDLRVTVAQGIKVEKHVRGVTAGYNTPTVVVDAPGGGGKREIHSYEHYDAETGISVYTAPAVKEGYFLYFDPIDLLPAKTQERWAKPAEQKKMIDAALRAAKSNRGHH